jgi:hypothetical protein
MSRTQKLSEDQGKQEQVYAAVTKAGVGAFNLRIK